MSVENFVDESFCNGHRKCHYNFLMKNFWSVGYKCQKEYLPSYEKGKKNV